MIAAAQVDRYLERIGAQRPERADLAALRHLQERHVLSVPFENVDYHVEGAEVSLDRDRILDKIVDRRRGGGCYELNPAFATLLGALGFTVSMLPGRVYLGGRFGPPLCHLALRVDLDEPYLVDVGFGKGSRRPLRIGETGVQHDPHGDYRVEVTEEGDIDAFLNGDRQYRLENRPTELTDYLPTFWWYRTAPDSVFRHNLITTLQTDFGRVTLNGEELTRTDRDGRRTERLVGEDAVRDAYEKHFGIVLDRLPTEPRIDPAERIVMQID
ncbi:arylamine N-acetyltransferase [Saccharothrix sp. HUAS TT1]|uniref:arylamine N-acetyltransferase family protein n=1 Tax=unclassified Saccharothrix TaxID=2593673 RepID=UPI00345BCB2C